ncbi:MAG: leucine-rich repeat domain-containing protein [Planctomycetota bacterium]
MADQDKIDRAFEGYDPEKGELDLSGCRLSNHYSLGSVLFRIKDEALDGLQKLDLHSNRISDLSPLAAATHLDSLIILHLHGNHISDLTPFMAAVHLGSLNTLTLDGNLISDLGPLALATHLDSLKVLQLTVNKIQDLNPLGTATHLGSLKELWLNLNRVRGLGPLAAAMHFGALEELYLASNQINDADIEVIARAWEVGRFPALRTVIIGSNANISHIDPEAFGNVTNPTNAETLFTAVLAGVRSPMARVMVLGDPCGGKTWLSRRVFKNEVVDVEREARRPTPDIDTIEGEGLWWKPTTGGDKRERIVLRVWDFAGQHIHHGIHEGFLDSRGRTVCLLVLDATQVLEEDPAEPDEEKDGNRLTYWLKNIAHFAGNEVPVVVAVTKAGAVEKLGLGGGRRPIERGLGDGVSLEEYIQAVAESEAVGFPPGKVRVVDDLDAGLPLPEEEPAADDADPEPVTKLRRVLEDALRRLPGMREQVHPALPALRRKVEAEVAERDVIPMEDYRAWCEELTYTEKDRKTGKTTQKQLTGAGVQDDLLGQLHRFGSVFYLGHQQVAAKPVGRRDENAEVRDLAPGQRRFLNREPAGLLRRYLLNPLWVKQPVYAVIEKASKTTGGLLDEDQILREAAVAGVRGVDAGTAGDLVMAAINRLELAFNDKEIAKFLFPIGLQLRGEAFMPDWARGERDLKWHGVLQWPFLPEAAFYRLIVRLSPRIVHQKRWRRGLVVGEPSAPDDYPQLLIEADPGAGRVSVLFRPPPDGAVVTTWEREAAELYREVRGHLVGDLVGVEPEERRPGFMEEREGVDWEKHESEQISIRSSCPAEAGMHDQTADCATLPDTAPEGTTKLDHHPSNCITCEAIRQAIKKAGCLSVTDIRARVDGRTNDCLKHLNATNQISRDGARKPYRLSESGEGS